MSTTRTTDGTNYTLSILCSQSNEKKRNCDQASGVNGSAGRTSSAAQCRNNGALAGFNHGGGSEHRCQRCNRQPFSWAIPIGTRRQFPLCRLGEIRAL